MLIVLTWLIKETSGSTQNLVGYMTGQKKLSFHQSPESSRTATVSAQHKSYSSQSGQNGQASTIVSTFYGPPTKENYGRLIVTALHITQNEKPLSNFPDLINL